MLTADRTGAETAPMSIIRVVEASYERVEAPPGTSWSWYVLRKTIFRFGWHFHREIELTLITAGTGQRYIGDSVEAYGPGDLVLIGSELPHTYASDPSGSVGTQEAVVAQFARDFLGAALFDRPEFEPIDRILTLSQHGLVFTSGSATQVARRFRQFGSLPDSVRTIALLNVLATLADVTPAPRSLASSDFSPQLDQASRERIDEVCRYLAESYASPVSLPEVAGIAHMSPSAFSRFFHRTIGHTFSAYLTQLRIAAACRLLLDTDLSISETASRSGYGNLSNFNRRFRQLKHMTPREYRAAFRGDQ
jgi:AraC-like DNA-binding protein